MNKIETGCSDMELIMDMLNDEGHGLHEDLIKEGKIINDGSPNEIIRSKIISDLFQISITVFKENEYWRGLPMIS